MWRALAAAQQTAHELRGPEYDHLAQRAEDQRRRADTARLEAAREALETGVSH